MDDDGEGTPPGKDYMDEVRKSISGPKSDIIESSEAMTEYISRKGNIYKNEIFKA